jgi:hypothetical protein
MKIALRSSLPALASAFKTQRQGLMGGAILHGGSDQILETAANGGRPVD